VHYLIHSGQHEVGHVCIEVAAGDGTRILLDLGMPLVARDGGDLPRGTAQRPARELITEGVLPDVAGLYPHDPAAPDVAAIVLTHSHLDHYGLAHHAHPAIPVYGSRGTIAILDVGRVFFPDAPRPRILRELPADKPVVFGALTVTAVPVDHAAPDSRALLVAGDGQRLLYTGDLRAHGRTGFRFEKLLSDGRVQGVDWLLCEGTTLGGSGGSHGLASEYDVEEELLGLARATPDKLLAVAASGQNVDRLVSCYKAARRAHRQLVIDAYQAYVLMKLAPLSFNIPQFSWDAVRVQFPHHQFECLRQAGLMRLVCQMRDQGHITSEELAAQPGHFLLCTRGSFGLTRLLDKVRPELVVLVWSLWRGYWERGGALRDWVQHNAIEVRFVHSGGHAWPRDLERLVTALAPSETVWVHTDASVSGRPSRRHSQEVTTT
jgi:ribonuclease J